MSFAESKRLASYFALVVLAMTSAGVAASPVAAYVRIGCVVLATGAAILALTIAIKQFANVVVREIKRKP